MKHPDQSLIGSSDVEIKIGQQKRMKHWRKQINYNIGKQSFQWMQDMFFLSKHIQMTAVGTKIIVNLDI